MISPHAGWLYSGNAAGQTFAWLANAQPDADLAVIFGSHRGPHGPNTIFLGEGWETPLGIMKNAQSLAERLKTELTCIEEPLDPPQPDNGVEVLLPFVRHFFPKAELLMLGIEASPKAVTFGEHVARAVGEAQRKAVFIGSTDLTHYGPNYRFEPRGPGDTAVRWVRDENDRGFIDTIVRGDASGAIAHAAQYQSACCPGAAGAALAAARTLHAPRTPQLVSHYLSCEVRPATSFVGYAGIVF